MNGTAITEEKQQSEVLDKDFFLECMRSVVRRMQKQEQMIQVLVDDLRMRNHEGVLYLRGERMYSTQELVNSLRVSRKTLMRYRNAGNLPYIILRNSAYYKESNVEKLITQYGNRLDKKAVAEFLANMNKNKNGDILANK